MRVMGGLGYVPSSACEGLYDCECAISFYRKDLSPRAQGKGHHTAARKWRERAAPGYCKRTASGVLGDCSAGDSGSLALPIGNHSEVSVVAHCLAACAACERCQFVSVSARWRDCSWFSSCALDRLRTNVAGFLSGPALNTAVHGGDS